MARFPRACWLLVAAIMSGAASQAPLTKEQLRDRMARAVELLRQNANAEALSTLEPVVAEPLANDPAVAGDLRYYLGQACYKLAKYPEAIEHWQRALESERATHDRSGEARTLRALSQLDKNQGRYTEGIALGEQAAAIYAELGDTRNAGLAWIVLGAIHDSVGDYQLALQSYEHATAAFGTERSANRANALYEIGITYKNLGQYSEALRHYSEALDIYKQLNDLGNQAVVLGNTGVLYGTLGDDERGVEYNQAALALARQVKDRRGETIGLLNLADSYWRLGKRERAIEALEQDLALARSIGARTETALALKNLGDIHSVAGETTRAREYYDEALRIQRDMGERRTEESTLIALSDLALHEHHANEAVELARQALTIAHDTGRAEYEWNARRSLAAASAALGRTDEAIDELRASARIINDLRANVAADTAKIAFVDQRRDVFDDLASLLVARGRSDEALETAEAGRARAFADLLEQRQVVGKPKERETLRAVRLAGMQLRNAMVAGPSQGASSATRASGSAPARAWDSSLAALDAGSHELASLLTAETPRARDIAATTARLHAALVEYLVTDSRLLIWVVEPDGVIHSTSVDVTRERLESLTRAVRRGVDRSDGSAPGPAGNVRAPVRELDRLLIAPVAAWLPASWKTTVVIVPHGPLALLPFAALEDSAGRALIERHVLAFAPAASVYSYTREKRQPAAVKTRGALIIADPTPPADSGIARLPGARDEGRRIARRLRAGPVRLLIGNEATEAAVKRDAGTYAVLHFATHGLVAPERPLASSIVLSADEKNDGYLRVDEIFGLDLSADLVVLSGCSSGLGRLTGDGIVGLTRAFLYAGTPTVVVSQWNVSDRATAVLMDRFYAELAQGHSKAEALRAAALSTRRLFPHPSFWAAFELVGEPD
jgi:CHAT domain-containing protein/tetratricopeptide (TPR) repeat protein